MCSVSGERGSWTSEDAFKQINSILDCLADEDIAATPAETMGEDQIALRRIESRVQAEVLRRLRRFDRGQGFASSGALSAKAWLRWQCNVLDNTASDQVNVARLLDSLPQTAEAFANGDFSYRHAALIAHTAEKLSGKMDPHAEEILVKAAKEMDPRRLRIGVWHLRHCLEPDGVQRDTEAQYDVMVTVDMATLTKADGSRGAELEWAPPITAETVRRLACDCTITPVLFGGESHQVEVGPVSRKIPAPMKRALIARDKGCRFPGCDMPAA